MPHYLSAHELGQTAPAELDSFESPVPTQVVSNGEYNPLPQTPEQRRVEARIKALADELGPRHGLSRRAFLASSAGMAAAFLAMNDVFGRVFEVSPAEAQQPGVAAQRAGALAGQGNVDGARGVLQTLKTEFPNNAQIQRRLDALQGGGK